MAEWLRLRTLEENGLNIRLICCVRIPLPKKSIGWADGTEVTSRRYYGWHRPHFWAAGWPSGYGSELYEENGLNIRRICGGSNPAAKKSIGWADGDEKHVPSLLWLA